MAKKKDDKDSETSSRVDPKHDERRRLRSLAFSRNLLSKTPSRPPSSPLRPSAAVVRYQGRDLVKKGQRRNRFLFSFPGFIAPVGAGGKIGELADLATGNPVLYLEFPQGRMKLFGTIVYPKNRYLTLQFARKSVLCEDTFDSMIVFSDAWWIGTKEENPEESKLDFPREFSEVKDADLDCFKGGVSANSRDKPVGRSAKEVTDPLSPEIEINDDDDTSQDFLIETDDNITNSTQATPVRQSSRLVGKSLNFAEKSSSDESGDSDRDNSNSAWDLKVENDDHQVPLDTENTGVKRELMQNSEIPPPPEVNLENSSKKKGRLVQCTLSTLFVKATVKKADNSAVVVSPELKGSGTKRQRKSSIDKTSAINGSNKHVSSVDMSPVPRGSGTKRESKSSTDKTNAVNVDKKHGSTGVKAGVKRKLKLHKEEEDDDDVEISSESQEEDSDEEWVA